MSETVIFLGYKRWRQAASRRRNGSLPDKPTLLVSQDFTIAALRHSYAMLYNDNCLIIFLSVAARLH